jgi:4-hydroxy-tetrahydrodipicolinate synthase
MTLHGIIPPMTTPFGAEGELKLDLLRGQVDWLVSQGVHGLAAGGSTGEGHTLDAAEFRDLVAATVEAAGGRVPVIAGIIVDSTRDAIRRARTLRDLNVAALQVTPVHYLFRPDDEAMLTHFKTVAQETGMPVIIYNVVPWSYLSPELLVRIMRAVPGVIGVKQSAGDLKLVADLLNTADPNHLILSAVDALLYPSFALGAQGSIAAILTAAPRACVDLSRPATTAARSTSTASCCRSGTRSLATICRPAPRRRRRSKAARRACRAPPCRLPRRANKTKSPRLCARSAPQRIN